MGKRGPAPKPTALKRLNGNPGHRPLNDDDLTVPASVPEAPENLCPAARDVWYRLGAKLASHGLITDLDEAAFAVLCESYAAYLELIVLARKDGPLVMVNGQPVPNPYLCRSDKEAAKVQKLLAEFGLTPSSRARLNISPPAKDAADEFNL